MKPSEGTHLRASESLDILSERKERLSGGFQRVLHGWKSQHMEVPFKDRKDSRTICFPRFRLACPSARIPVLRRDAWSPASSLPSLLAKQQHLKVSSIQNALSFEMERVLSFTSCLESVTSIPSRTRAPLAGRTHSRRRLGLEALLWHNLPVCASTLPFQHIPLLRRMGRGG